MHVGHYQASVSFSLQSLGPAVKELGSAILDTLDDISGCLATLGSYDGWSNGQLLSLYILTFEVNYPNFLFPNVMILNINQKQVFEIFDCIHVHIFF